MVWRPRALETQLRRVTSKVLMPTPSSQALLGGYRKMVLLCSSVSFAGLNAMSASCESSFYDLEGKMIDPPMTINFAAFCGRPVLMLNVASK